MNNSFLEGTESERLFIQIRGNNFKRRATKEEDINEHWDVLDKELGRIDVKSAKRKSRWGDIDNTIWWELRTVKRPPLYKSCKGWGIPNGIDRLIAIRFADSFIMINPEHIIEDLRKRCTKKGKGEFLLYSRPDRGDLMTILPLSYARLNSVMEIKI